MGIFDSVMELTKDVFEVAVTPIEMAVDVADAVVKPMAQAAQEIKNDIKLLKD